MKVLYLITYIIPAIIAICLIGRIFEDMLSLHRIKMPISIAMRELNILDNYMTYVMIMFIFIIAHGFFIVTYTKSVEYTKNDYPKQIKQLEYIIEKYEKELDKQY